MKQPRAIWPPGRRGFPTCPLCKEPIEFDPGPGGVYVSPDDPLVGHYAHTMCALAAAGSVTPTGDDDE